MSVLVNYCRYGINSFSKLTKVMKAVQVENFGGPEVLKVRETKIPCISKSEVLIKIKSAGVNPVDTYIREGAYTTLPDLPYVPGKEGAGVIEDIGNNVSHLKKGQRAFVCFKKSRTFGTYAEYVAADSTSVFPLADRLNYDQGAALGIAYFTAYRALILKGKASANDQVLIHGASGGVGLAATQMAKAYKMHVIGTAGTQDGMDLVKNSGADHVICHKDKDYLSHIMGLTQGRKFDVIIEMLSNVNLNKDLDLLAPKGRVMVVGCRGPVSINPRAMMGPETHIIGVALLSSSEEEWKQTTDAILKGIDEGWVNPVVDKKYSLEQVSDAHYDVIHSKGAKGKLVISVDPN